MKNTIHHGDCLELMKIIPDGSIDMILCDLPYGTTQNKWDTIIPFEPLWENYKRIIKDNGVIVLTASQPFTSSLIMSNPKMFRYDMVWHKPLGSGFLNAKKMPLRNHESIIIFYKKLPTYNPIMRKGVMRTKGRKKDWSSENYGTYKPQQQTSDTYYPNSILSISNSDRNTNHPTQKPVALFEYLIKTYTNEGDTVLDNCAGSGTTAEACINTNRNYILMEQEQKYIDIIKTRLNITDAFPNDLDF